MSAELLPCPFCGESLSYKKVRDFGDDLGYDCYAHPDNDCALASTGLGDPFEVLARPEEIAIWNRRAGVKA